MDPLESYLTRLREIRSSGQAQPETSYYDALANLLNEIGKSLKPKVRCNMQLKNLGGGMWTRRRQTDAWSLGFLPLSQNSKGS